MTSTKQSEARKLTAEEALARAKGLSDSHAAAIESITRNFAEELASFVNDVAHLNHHLQYGILLSIVTNMQEAQKKLHESVAPILHEALKDYLNRKHAR